jgi:manganese transport protein
MAGFIGRQIPMWLRRIVTMLPALIVLAVGADPTKALVFSQVVLSFGIPLALVPLVVLTGRRSLMGTFANRGLMNGAAWLTAIVITALNVFLIVQALGG